MPTSYKFQLLQDNEATRNGAKYNIEGIDISNYNQTNENGSPAGVVLYNHNGNEVVGNGRVYKEEGILYGEYFPDLSTEQGKKVAAQLETGVLQFASVGLRPIKVQETDEAIFTYTDKEGETVTRNVVEYLETELGEFSIVSVPGNPQAQVQVQPSQAQVKHSQERSNTIIYESSTINPLNTENMPIEQTTTSQEVSKTPQEEATPPVTTEQVTPPVTTPEVPTKNEGMEGMDALQKENAALKLQNAANAKILADNVALKAEALKIEESMKKEKEAIALQKEQAKAESKKATDMLQQTANQQESVGQLHEQMVEEAYQVLTKDEEDKTTKAMLKQELLAKKELLTSQQHVNNLERIFESFGNSSTDEELEKLMQEGLNTAEKVKSSYEMPAQVRDLKLEYTK